MRHVSIIFLLSVLLILSCEEDTAFDSPECEGSALRSNVYIDGELHKLIWFNLFNRDYGWEQKYDFHINSLDHTCLEHNFISFKVHVPDISEFRGEYDIGGVIKNMEYSVATPSDTTIVPILKRILSGTLYVEYFEEKNDYQIEIMGEFENGGSIHYLKEIIE